jgi:hypothetical protein
LTAFENFFSVFKKILGSEGLYDVWPDFEPQYDEHEYAWSALVGIGEVLVLNCGVCDCPSDPRYVCCKECVEKRSKTATDAYQKATGHPEDKWVTLFLCRIHTE